MAPEVDQAHGFGGSSETEGHAVARAGRGGRGRVEAVEAFSRGAAPKFRGDGLQGGARRRLRCFVLVAAVTDAALFMVAYFRKQNRLGNPRPGVDVTFYLKHEQ